MLEISISKMEMRDSAAPRMIENISLGWPRRPDENTSHGRKGNAGEECLVVRRWKDGDMEDGNMEDGRWKMEDGNEVR